MTNMDYEIKTLPAMRLATVPHSGPYHQIGPAFGKLGSIAGPAGLFAQPGAMMLGIYKDDPTMTPADQLRSAACIVIPEGVPIPSGLVEDRIDAGKYACLVHLGPYEGLPAAWMKMRDALGGASRVRRRQAPACEIYWNDPSRVPPAELKTEICVPVE
jgi:AraC family transcriptional regulator